MAITWQQVAAPDLTDVSRILGQGAANAGEGLKSIASAFDPIREASKVRKNELTNLNTLNEIQNINAIKDVNQLNSYLSGLNPQALTQKHGDAIDLSKVLNVAASAKTNLQNAIGVDQKFSQDQLKFSENPMFLDLSEKINAATDINQLNSLIQPSSQLQSDYGNQLVQSINDRKNELVNKQQSQEDRANNNKLRSMQLAAAGRTEASAQADSMSGQYFSTDFLNNLKQITDVTDVDQVGLLQKDLEGQAWFQKGTTEQQNKWRSYLNDQLGLNSQQVNAAEKTEIGKLTNALTLKSQEYTNKYVKPVENEIQNVDKLLQAFNKPDAIGGFNAYFDKLDTNKLSEVKDLTGDRVGGLSAQDRAVMQETYTNAVDRVSTDLPSLLAAQDKKDFLKLTPEEQNQYALQAKSVLTDGLLYKTLEETKLTEYGDAVTIDSEDFQNKLIKNIQLNKDALSKKNELANSLIQANQKVVEDMNPHIKNHAKYLTKALSN